MIKQTKYLNSDFLETALHVIIPETKTVAYYMRMVEFGIPITPDSSGFAEVGMELEKKELVCKTITIPKTDDKCLVDYIEKLLLDKYFQLAESNEKSVWEHCMKKTILESTKIIKWIKGSDNSILLNNDEASKIRLISKIIRVSNGIAHNSRYGPADFIIAPIKMLNYLYSLSAVYEEVEIYNSPKINDKIFLFGNFSDLGDVYIQTYYDNDTILVGRKSKDFSMSCVSIIVNNTEIDDKQIKWTGLIEEISPDTKYVYDTVKFKLVDNLSFIKKLAYKILTKYFKKEIR
jgi:hypothetical protein